jgi:hypothetical protein
MILRSNVNTGTNADKSCRHAGLAVEIVSGKPLRPGGGTGRRFNSRSLQQEIGMRPTLRHSFESLTPFLMLTGVFLAGLALAAVLARIVGAVVLYILHAF